MFSWRACVRDAASAGLPRGMLYRPSVRRGPGVPTGRRQRAGRVPSPCAVGRPLGRLWCGCAGRRVRAAHGRLTDRWLAAAWMRGVRTRGGPRLYPRSIRATRCRVSHPFVGAVHGRESDGFGRGLSLHRRLSGAWPLLHGLHSPAGVPPGRSRAGRPWSRSVSQPTPSRSRRARVTWWRHACDETGNSGCDRRGAYGSGRQPGRRVRPGGALHSLWRRAGASTAAVDLAKGVHQAGFLGPGGHAGIRPSTRELGPCEVRSPGRLGRL